MDTNPGRTPQQLAAWNRWHWILAILLILLLLALWAMGHGPQASLAGDCCATGAAPVTPPLAAVATPPQADGDADGLPDATDQCPETPAGHRVGPRGCSCDISLQLQFETDSAVLTAEDRARLNAAVELLDRYHFTTGEVAGYASSEGDAAHNLELSQQRAQSVVAYLLSKGIATDRLTATAYGETSAMAQNTTEAGRELNRRVIIRRSDCPAP